MAKYRKYGFGRIVPKKRDNLCVCLSFLTIKEVRPKKVWLKCARIEC